MNQRERLKELGVKPTEGQHFISSEYVERFLRHADTSGKTVMEIGPGTGAITGEVDAEKIYAVEKDTVLAEGLEDVLEDVQVINDDFLEVEFPEDVEHVIGNIPFEISSDILEKLGEAQLQATLLVQEDFADKIVAGPGDSDYSFQAFRAGYYFVPVKADVIPSQAYFPEPEVSTAVLKLFPNRERHGVEDDQALLDFAKALFTHKRKKVRNAFVDARHILDLSKEEAKELRDQLPHSERRVNDLEVSEMGDVMKFYSSRTS